MTIKNPALIPPRCDFFDQRTGKIAREWYLYLLNLGNLTIDAGNANDLAVEVAFNNDNTSQVSELTKIIDRLDVDNSDPFAVTGTVRYVNATAPNGVLSVGGVPYQHNGTITHAWSGTSGGVPYFSGVSSMASSALLGATQVVLGGGAGNAPNTSANLTFDGTTLTTTGLNVTGNTVIGDASADTLTQNYGTVTVGNNYVATRAAGAAAAGVTNAVNNVFSYSADAGGTTDYRGWLDQITLSGANASSALVMHRNEAIHGGSALTGTVQVNRAQVNLTSTGNATNVAVNSAGITVSSTGSIVGTANMYAVATVGTFQALSIATLNGYSTTATTTAGHIGEYNAFNALATTGPTLAYAFRGQHSAASGRYNLGMTGTAMNVLAGNTRIGGSTDPTVALDVTGAALISSTLGVSGVLTLNSNVTLGSNTTTSRAAGTVGSGNAPILQTTVSASGNATPSNIQANVFTSTFSGANAMGSNAGVIAVIVHNATGGSTSDSAFLTFYAKNSGGDTVSVFNHYNTGGSGSVTSGTVTTMNGLRVVNISGAAIGTVHGVLVDDQSGATTAMNGITLNLSAGTGKRNLNIIGTAANLLTGITTFGNKIYPGTDAATTQANTGLYAGNGVPNNANGANGDFYMRGDGTVAGNTVMYHKEGGAWVAFTTT
jgi:hypothetical protein